MRHGEVSRQMFPGHRVEAITNGVHAEAWITKPIATLFDRHIPDWRRDNCYLRHAIGFPLQQVREAHAETKRELLQQVRWLTGSQLDDAVFTLGFARRATAYKRGDLLFTDLERLKNIARQVGPLQLIFAGFLKQRQLWPMMSVSFIWKTTTWRSGKCFAVVLTYGSIRRCDHRKPPAPAA
jgi:starch phosphorylase